MIRRAIRRPRSVTRLDEIDAAASPRDLVALVQQRIAELDHPTRCIRRRRALREAFEPCPQPVAGTHGHWPLHVFPGDAADPCDVAADLVIEPAPQRHRIDTRRYNLAKHRIPRRVRVCVEVLRVVRARESEEGVEFDGLLVRFARFADDQIVIKAASANCSHGPRHGGFTVPFRSTPRIC